MASSISAARNPMAATFWSTLESGGSDSPQKTGSLSTPTTAIRSGTAIPASRHASRMRTPWTSLQARMPVGAGSEVSHRVSAFCSRSQVDPTPGSSVSKSA
ncbi:MAG: hypothetical protein R3F11_15075 [Verrucomicrobiales bacterium]